MQYYYSHSGLVLQGPISRVLEWGKDRSLEHRKGPIAGPLALSGPLTFGP